MSSVPNAPSGPQARRQDSGKQLVFAGSTVGEPWWAIGRITADLLRPEGFDVEVSSASASTENPRWVGSGRADVGACVPRTLGWAMAGEQLYEGEEFPEFRAIAAIRRPWWLAVAIRSELGFRDLREAADSGFPLRILTNRLTAIASVVPRMVLEHYGLSEQAVAERGGTFLEMTGIYQPHVREHNVDVIVSNLYLGNTAISRYWNEASVLLNLRFSDLEEPLIDALAAAGHGVAGALPMGLVRGVSRDVRTLEREDAILVYVRADEDPDFCFRLAQLYHEQRHRFFRTAVHMALDPGNVTATSPLHLHEGAQRYWQQAGLLD